MRYARQDLDSGRAPFVSPELVEGFAPACTHPNIVPIDADWARCTSCGDDTFPLHAPALDERLEQDAAPQAAPPKAKRRKGKSPTQRTLDELRRRGWTAQVVERPWNKFSKVTLDLFGVIDLVAIVPPSKEYPPYGHLPGAILGIQATTGTNHASRRTKILAEPRAKEWVDAGGRLELWTWSQRVAYKANGSKSVRPAWTLRVETYAEMVAAASEGA